MEGDTTAVVVAITKLDKSMNFSFRHHRSIIYNNASS
jgi:hypothetical protein